MSFREFLCVLASPETPASRRKDQQRQRCRFRNSGAHTGTRSAARGLGEVGAPYVVIGRASAGVESSEIWVYTQDDKPRTGRHYIPIRNPHYNESITV